MPKPLVIELSFVDLNGDGLVDVVTSRPDNTVTFINQRKQATKLSSITNGFGIQTQSYLPCFKCTLFVICGVGTVYHSGAPVFTTPLPCFKCTLFVRCGVGTPYHSGAPEFTPLPSRVLNVHCLSDVEYEYLTILEHLSLSPSPPVF